MRFLGRSCSLLSRFKALQPAFFAIAVAGFLACLSSQTATAQAPYILPYTLTQYAGGIPAYVAGANCFTLGGAPASKALTTAGDGCFAPNVYVGSDPHDLRIDPAGNIYYIDNSGSGTIIHKFNPYTGQETVYGGGATVCTTFITGIPTAVKEGDGCSTPASDGVANNTAKASDFTKDGRGLGVAPNGDLYFAGYNDYYDHRIAAATDLLTIVAGDGAATAPEYAPPAPGTASPVISSTEYQSRGISADQYGNVFIADTGNNVIRETYMGNGGSVPGVSAPVAGNVYTITALNSATTANATPANNVPSVSATVYKPEDVQVDTFGNVYISDTSDSMIRAIYMGTGTLIGVPAGNLVKGNIYNIAGFGTGTNTTTYPGGNATIPTIGQTEPALSISIGSGIRKFSIDRNNNLYIADSSNNVVWFVDATTATIRVLAGDYGLTAGSQAPPGCTGETDIYGDGCPALDGTFYGAVTSSTGLGTSADSFGNLYITDPQAGQSGAQRIHKVTSGLNFPTLAVGSSATQNVLIHFAAGDTPAASTPFVIKGTGSDFAVGTQNCAVANDTTDDCILPVTFKPSVSGFDTAVLTVTTTKGALNTFVLTGNGTAPTIAFDPGNTALLSTTVAATAVKNSQGVALDSAGNAYIADTGNNRVLFYNATSATTTVFAGAGTVCSGKTDSFGDGCLATAATLNAPRAVAIDSTGAVYIADTGNNVIRKVSNTGIITLYAGNGTACTAAYNTRGDGCPGLQATFSSPSGLVADNIGNLFVADSGNNVIREIASNSYVTTFAGGGTPCTTNNTDTVGDGCSALAATFSNPTGLAFDPIGKNLIIADTGDNRVRKIYLSTTYTVSGTNTVSNILINPVNQVAGNGQAGDSLNSANTAILSQVSGPTGVAVGTDGTIYIADTGNHSVRMVTTGGNIFTIAGILGTSGTGTLGNAATSTELNLPAALAINNIGTLFIADSGNNRILTDTRNQITYNFGVIGITLQSPIQNFTELNIGTTAANLPASFTQTPVNSQFTLASVANSNGSISACASGTFASGAICNLQGQFAPTTTGPQTSPFTETTTGASGATPTITLQGNGQILTTTSSTVAQTTPTPPAQPQYGQPLVLTATVTPSVCNTNAPACYPTGTITFIVDGVSLAPITATGSGTSATATQSVSGLSAGNHTVACIYSGDNFYGGSTCSNVVITVVPATTTSSLVATVNNQAQYPTTSCVQTTANGSLEYTTCTAQTITVTVTSASGIPTGSVAFTATTGTTTINLGTRQLGGSPAQATFQTQYIFDPSHDLISDNTLAPGTYTLGCTYSGAANFAVSSCTGVTFTVLPQTPSIALYPRGCSIAVLSVQFTTTPIFTGSCQNTEVTVNNIPATSGGTPIVSVADGSTTDAAIFVQTSNTLTGTLTTSCSGMPASTICTFSPSTLSVSASNGYVNPTYFDVTFWTDLQPGSTTSSLRSPSIGQGKHKTNYALMLGWPLTFFGLVALLLRRRKTGLIRGLSLLGICLLMFGSSLLITSCAGPGAQTPVLTPSGTYPITITVSGDGVSASTIVDFRVTSPGIPGQE